MAASRPQPGSTKGPGGDEPSGLIYCSWKSIGAIDAFGTTAMAQQNLTGASIIGI